MAHGLCQLGCKGRGRPSAAQVRRVIDAVTGAILVAFGLRLEPALSVPISRRVAFMTSGRVGVDSDFGSKGPSQIVTRAEVVTKHIEQWAPFGWIDVVRPFDQESGGHVNRLDSGLDDREMPILAGAVRPDDNGL